LIDASALVDSVVEYLRDIPELVSAMGGDEERIYAYHDRYPEHVSIDQARYEMTSPGIMVAWNGTYPGGGGFEAWQHELNLTLRAQTESGDDSPSAYYNLFRLITRGIPTGETVRLQYLTIHPSCNPMDTPSIRRETDAMGIDYWSVTMIFTEIGDE
jgi:hypothetical protein